MARNESYDADAADVPVFFSFFNAERNPTIIEAFNFKLVGLAGYTAIEVACK